MNYNNTDNHQDNTYNYIIIISVLISDTSSLAQFIQVGGWNATFSSIVNCLPHSPHQFTEYSDILSSSLTEKLVITAKNIIHNSIISVTFVCHPHSYNKRLINPHFENIEPNKKYIGHSSSLKHSILSFFTTQSRASRPQADGAPWETTPAARKSKNILLSNLVVFTAIQTLTSPMHLFY